jgi:hypothetical protein
LLWADAALAGRFGERRKPPSPGRVALLAFWDDDSALDRFLDEHPVASALSGGWMARLEPLRAFGSWPGLPDDISRERSVSYDGPAVVLTLGRLRLSQTVRFLRTSSKAEAKAAAAPGAIFATGLARPPFLATCSVWEDSRSLSSYAYGNSDPRHLDAIHAQAAKDFHKQSAFVRFRPYDVRGSLGGKNPLAENALSVA